jgi:subtilase family serine protease
MTRRAMRSVPLRPLRRRAHLALEQLEARNLMAYSPAQIAHAYGFDQVTFANGTVKGDGTGQTIAIVDAFDDPTILSDLRHFDATYGLPDPPSFQKLMPQGQPGANSGWAMEMALDVEWAHSIAPKANIILVEAKDNSDTSLFAADVFAAQQPGVSVVSNSWAGGEYGQETNADANFVHPGVTFIFSAGDSGAGALYPSASPNVLSIGGTTLHLDSNGNWLSETAWSSSGGGPSQVETKPSFQSGITLTTTRGTPDVSFDANPGTGVSVYDSNNGGWLQVGGTSLGAPAWAGLIAIVNQGRALSGNPSYNGGDLLTRIYQVSANDFHDITSGSNSYQAGPGYDFVTGRGSPIANLLIPDLVGTGTTNNQPPLPPSNLSATAGDGQDTLSWTASAGATSYNIYRSLTKGGEGATPYKTGVTGTSFTDTGLTDGTTYYYTVTAVDALGESAQSAEVSATPQKATTSLAIDAGGGAVGNFVADTDYRGGSTYSTSHAIDTSGVTNPAPQSVYQTERYGNFRYTIPNLTPGASYTVRLDFAEIYWNQAGRRLFNVKINGSQVLTNFDVFATAGGKYKAIAEQFTAVADASGNLTIQFISVRDNAKVSGIEISLAAGASATARQATGGIARLDHGFVELASFLTDSSSHSRSAWESSGGGVSDLRTNPVATPNVVAQTNTNAASDSLAMIPRHSTAAEPDWTNDLLMGSGW